VVGPAGAGDKGEDTERAECSNRQVDIEAPAPVEVLSQPTAQYRAGDWPHHRTGAENRHCKTVALARVHPIEHGLAEWHEPGAAYALQPAIEHQLRKARSSAAQADARVTR